MLAQLFCVLLIASLLVTSYCSKCFCDTEYVSIVGLMNIFKEFKWFQEKQMKIIKTQYQINDKEKQMAMYL